MKLLTITFIYLTTSVAGLICISPIALAHANPSRLQLAETATTQNAQVNTSNAGIATKVAAGELLPISVKLSNFGGGKRVDVLVKYSIFNNNGNEIYSASETVAVETTDNFIKKIQVPFGTTPGTYTAKTSVTYQGQQVPATTQFSFTVERKILGIFQSDFILYGSIAIIISILLVLLGRLLIKRQRAMRFIPFDYSNIPHSKRTFYEILSDTIMQMRGRVGDDALIIASNINGLKIDIKTGRILTLTDKPAKIIATLVSEYEKRLGKKVSFSFRREKMDSAHSTLQQVPSDEPGRTTSSSQIS